MGLFSGLRGETPTAPPPDPSFQPAGDEVPYALRIGAAWSWRLVMIVLVAWGLFYVVAFFSVLIIPLMIAALLAGLLSPLVRALHRNRVPKGLAVAIVEIGFIVVVAGALTLVGRQIVSGISALWGQARAGYEQLMGWLQSGPLQLSTAEIDRYLQQVVRSVQDNSSTVLSGAASVGTTAGHVAAGLLLTVFSLIFFLLDGDRIWRFVVGMLPRRARPATDGAGRRGWQSMVSWVRVQILVAAIDAIGIGVGALVIGVPLAIPLAVLVFLGSFIPIVGALVTGSVAVLLALVALGPIQAVIMLAVVLLVQQIEGHILQPLIMGRAVSLHPLAVVLAVTGGSLVAGIAGALFSVPLLAVVNTVIRYLAGRQWETDPLLVGSGADGYGRHAEDTDRQRQDHGRSGADAETAAVNATGADAPDADRSDRSDRSTATTDVERTR
ncbi:AI-2E family transporter [Tersicoccus phoenicis]|uniref:AI-2E family transporter n=1 Tax=Tersicoccus phoenicis TaxID=554083 RepID=UPI000A07140D|nr:AI-2E family transporter [Tersicoccus phoenicis]